MPILIDTQAIVWAVTDNPRLSARACGAITDGAMDILVSAVTAYEFVDLNRRGRFGADLPFQGVLNRLEARVLDYLREAWTIAEMLPPIHLDPVDRMLIAHALLEDMTLLTADTKIPLYPVRTIW